MFFFFVIFAVMSEEKINAILKLIRPGKSKLALVKAILSLRHVTGFGLKEAKDFVDSTDEKFSKYAIAKPAILELPLTKAELAEFQKSLDNCEDILYELTDFSQLRAKKLIQLGLYDKDEIVKLLVEEDLFQVLRKKDFDSVRELLFERYSNLPENYIKEKLSI